MFAQTYCYLCKHIIISRCFFGGDYILIFFTTMAIVFIIMYSFDI